MLSERVYPTNFGYILSTENACLAREHQPPFRFESRNRGVALNRQAEGVACRPSSLWLFGGDQLFVVFALAIAIVFGLWLAHQDGSGEHGRAPGEVVP